MFYLLVKTAGLAKPWFSRYGRKCTRYWGKFWRFWIEKSRKSENSRTLLLLCSHICQKYDNHSWWKQYNNNLAFIWGKIIFLKLKTFQAISDFVKHTFDDLIRLLGSNRKSDRPVAPLSYHCNSCRYIHSCFRCTCCFLGWYE